MTAPTSLWDLSTTPGSNTSVQGNSVAEGCAPSGINDAIRALAAMNKGALIAVSSAGTDTYTATLAPAPDALITGMGVYIKFGNANLLSSSTLSVNGLTQKTIVKNGAAAIQAGDIPAGHNGSLCYDGTNWVLLNPSNYAEGSWTPTFVGTGTAGTFTYAIQVGRYIRIGNLVTVWCTLQVSAISVSPTGNLTIGGLPFAASTITNFVSGAAIAAIGGIAHAASRTQFTASVASAASAIALLEAGDNVTAVAVVSSNLGSAGLVELTLTYRIN